MERYRQNLALLELVANSLGDLLPEITFVGGCTTILLVDEAAFGGVRQTEDVDIIVDVATLLEYRNLGKRLRSRGYRESREGPICRWENCGGEVNINLDVMPNSEEILGFSNRWYKDAMANSNTHNLPSGIEIKVVSSGYFLATKFEAFLGRGQGNYAASHDLEDIVFVLENRSNLIRELISYPQELKSYLGFQAEELLVDEFLNVLPGMLSHPDSVRSVEGYLKIMIGWKSK